MEIAEVDHTAAPTAETLVTLQRRAYRVEAEIIGFAEIPNIFETVDQLRRLPLRMLAAVVDGTIVGFVGFSHVDRVVDIDRLAVDPDKFRRGIARALLAGLHDMAPDATFVVSTPSANAPAVSLYESLGYRRTASKTVGDRLDVVVLQRRAATATPAD